MDFEFRIKIKVLLSLTVKTVELDKMDQWNILLNNHSLLLHSVIGLVDNKRLEFHEIIVHWSASD